jgi:hypothetical protein
MSTPTGVHHAEHADAGFPVSYREVQIGKTLYCVTSVFNGEKELGPTLERLAARHVLKEMETRAAEAVRACG